MRRIQQKIATSSTNTLSQPKMSMVSSYPLQLFVHVNCHKVAPQIPLSIEYLNQMGGGDEKSVSMRKGRGPVKFELPVGGKKDTKPRAPKGYVPVLVGEAKDQMQKFLVSVEVFKQHSFVGLLEMAAQEFGYAQKGVLMIPCDVVYFRQVLEVVSKDM